MSLRCFILGHCWPEYPPAQRTHEGMDECGEMDNDVYTYRCECERCGKVEYFVTDAVPFQLPWNCRTHYGKFLRKATADEIAQFDLHVHDRVTGGVFTPTPKNFAGISSPTYGTR